MTQTYSPCVPQVESGEGLAVPVTLGAERSALVTPADTDLGYTTRLILITTVGTLKITTPSGQTLTYPSGMLATQTQYQIAATRIWAESTATGIAVWY